MNLYPGSLDDYFRYCDEENYQERKRREEYVAASKTQCSHGRTLVQRCIPCEVEAVEG